MPSFITKAIAPIQHFLDQTGMYRVVTIALVTLALITHIYGLLGVLPYTFLEQILSLVVALIVALISNIGLARLRGIHANHESVVITALIIFFLVVPAQLTQLTNQWIVATVVLLAMLSKYLIVWRRQHIVNPAAAGAIGLALVYAIAPVLEWSLSPSYFETGWWIGAPSLFIPLVLVGALVVTKVRKWTPVLAFITTGFIVYTFEDWRFGADPVTSYERFVIAGPSLFLAFFMLTEPFTSPPTKRLQLAYGVVVGVVANLTIFAPLIKMTPELALVIGNIAFWPTTLRRKLVLPLRETRQLARNTWEFVFEKPAGLRFQAGQYLEWMLSHERPDSRGERRYFTIASSPTEAVVRLALKVIGEQGSTFKTALQKLAPGETIVASQLAGDFLLPRDHTMKLGFIAGGIGVTPFRSHIQYMVDTQSMHDTVLFYCNNTRADIAYAEEFTAASTHIPLTVVHVLAKETPGDTYEVGFVTGAMLARRVPDYPERMWYLSGPPLMVRAYDKMLKTAGVPTVNIIKDFFPGLA